MRKIVFGLVTIFMLLGCNSHDASMLKTFLTSDIFKKHNDTSISYEGYAFDAIINGVPVIEISNKNKIKSLEGYLDIASVRWQLLKPINGKNIIVNLKKRRIKEHDIGKILIYDITYHPLTPIKVKTKRVKVEGKTILVKGEPMVYYQEVLESLPLGDYVISLTARGTENWDRKEIFVEIREDNNASKLL